MPRVGKPRIRCAFDIPEALPKLPKVKKPRTVYTPEEKAVRALERLLKTEEREKKKELKEKKLEWEAKLPVKTGNTSLPNNIKVMFISDAKKQFTLSDRELTSLPIFQFRSAKKIIALSDLMVHAEKRLLDIGYSCPALEAEYEFRIPHVMTKTSDFLTGLIGRREGFSRGRGRF